jgi:predicted component of type VI protein secretion system
VGRGEECNVRIPLAAVSRKHCELSVDDDELVVKDLKSSNGTFVNGERVRSRELAPGDLLAVGPLVFVVRIDGHPKDIDPLESYVAGAVAPGAAGSKGDAEDAIAGVPRWGSQGAGGPAKGAAAPSAGGGGAAKGGAPARKEEEEKDEDQVDLKSLLDDFDFGDDEEEEPKAKKK